MSQPIPLEDLKFLNLVSTSYQAAPECVALVRINMKRNIDDIGCMIPAVLRIPVAATKRLFLAALKNLLNTSHCVKWAIDPKPARDSFVLDNVAFHWMLPVESCKLAHGIEQMDDTAISDCLELFRCRNSNDMIEVTYHLKPTSR